MGSASMWECSAGRVGSVGRDLGALSTTTRSLSAATSDLRKEAVLGATCLRETTSPPAHGDPGVGGGRIGASRRCVGTQVSASNAAVALLRGGAALVLEDTISGGAIFEAVATVDDEKKGRSKILENIDSGISDLT